MPARSRSRGNGEGSLFRRGGAGPWYASWYGGDGKRKERSTRTTSRSDAERIMRKWVERAALEREGLVTPEGGTELDRQAAAPIESHLDAFVTSKRAEGRSAKHIDGTRQMIASTADHCGWSSLGEVNAEGLERFVTRRQAAAHRPWTPRTAHKCVTAWRTFMRWCVADARLAADPLARVKKPTPTRQRCRRMLLVDEWRWLRAETEQGPDRADMTGRARRLLYELAIQTGLRSSELRSLTRSDLILDADRPHVLLDAGRTKNGKAARQFIQAQLADELSAWVAHAMPGAQVFVMPRREHVAKMLRADLAAARSAWLDQTGSDAALRMQRESSDFLLAEDHDGRHVDFHALRHTCGAWAAVGGASPKAIQTLMRHSSITLTLDTYGHLLPDEAAATVAKMPTVASAPLQLTGTHDTAGRADMSVVSRHPAVGPATAGRFDAIDRDSTRHPKTKTGPGEAPRPFQKRGGRDSNPQPPDRQSQNGVFAIAPRSLQTAF